MSHTPLLAIESTQQPISANWVDETGEAQHWQAGQAGPRLFEETRYRVRAKSLVPNQVPVLAHRDPLLFQDTDTFPDDLTCTGPINFRDQVGFSTLEVHVGHEVLLVTVEVFPTKLDYQHDYRALLSDVAGSARGLALEYLRGTYRSGGATYVEDATNVEWLTILRNEVATLERAVQYINDHPHRSLWTEVRHVRVDDVKRSTPSVRRSIIRRQGKGAWIDVQGIGRVRSAIPAIEVHETLDTPEHRWIRLNLKLILDRLVGLHSTIASEIAAYARSPRPVPARLRVEERETAGFVALLQRLLGLPIFDAAQGPPPIGFASLTLLSGVGYADVYRSIMVLRLGLNVEGDPFDLSVMDVSDLYEAWCFIELARIAAALTAGVQDVRDMLRIEESGIRVRLRRGQHSSIPVVGPDRTVIVSYNLDYQGLTGNQRPDIVLRFQHDGWPDLIVVFDAKYRLDASDEYQQRFGTPGPPQDAINALHRYRDAIVTTDTELGLQRPVVKGVALFPLGLEVSEGFAETQLAAALDVLGIGALPFLPGNSYFVTAWLESLVATPPEVLAEPGPPFAGLQEKHRRMHGLAPL